MVFEPTVERRIFVGLRVSQAEKAQLVEEARRRGTNISEMTRRALGAFFEVGNDVHKPKN